MILSTSYIRNEHGRWHVYSEKGKHLGGPYTSRSQAEHRLQQIHWFKHHGAVDTPPTPIVYLDRIPEELKSQPNWVHYTYIKAGNRYTKLPLSTVTHKAASTTEPETWAPFSAVSAYDKIGFVLAPPYVGVDIDNCVDFQGEISEFAQEIIDQLDSYTEYSPSRKGIHIIVRAEGVPSFRRDGVEVYTHGRFFTMTGMSVPGTSNSISEKSKELKQLHTEITKTAIARVRRAWEIGAERPFAFDPNSTVNEGRFRLEDPDTLKNYFRRASSTPGVSYVLGFNSLNNEVIQAVRFELSTWPENRAREWWVVNGARLRERNARASEDHLHLDRHAGVDVVGLASILEYQLKCTASKAVRQSLDYHGVTLDIEFPYGALRPEGRPLDPPIPAAYGFIRGTVGGDGDEVDIYLGPDPASEKIFKVEHFKHGKRKYSEDKWLLGFSDEESALAAYIDHKGSSQMGEVRQYTIPEFQALFSEVMASATALPIPSSKHGYPGRFIVFEGCDGSGKSTQVERIADAARAAGWDVLVTPWISSEYVASNIRKLKRNRQFTPRIGVLLCAADLMYRLDHLIIPALKQGKFVIADRYFYTSIAREVVRGQSPDFINSLYSDILHPDVVVYPRVSADTAISRIMSRNKGRLTPSEDCTAPDNLVNFYEAGLDLGLHPDPIQNFRMFLSRVCAMYDQISQQHGFAQVDAEQDLGTVTAEVLSKLQDIINSPRPRSVRAAAAVAEGINMDYSVYDFAPKFNEQISDYYIPDPSNPNNYVIEIGGIKVGFGALYILNRIIRKLLPKIYPSGHIPRIQVKSKPIPILSDYIVRRQGTVTPTVIEDPKVELKSIPQNAPSREGFADLDDSGQRGINNVKPTKT